MNKRLFLILAILFFLLAGAIYFGRNDIINLYNKISHSNIPLDTSTQQFSPSTDEAIQVTFLDIGQGDASFIEWPDETQMLVDCAIDARILEALGRVMKATDHTIDYLLVTHPDQDHYGGCVDVMTRFEVKHVIYTDFNKSSSNYFSVFMQTLQEEVGSGAEYKKIENEQIWHIASSSLHFLYPDMPITKHPLVVGKNPKDISNNTSIVFTLDFGTQRVLFTGDMEFEEENYLMKKYVTSTLDIDVLKVGHHGSAGSTSDAFLKMTTPSLASISSGRENRYGHPTLRTLKRLERASTEVWRTDQKGDIILRVTKDDVYVENQ